jgi:Na+/melibiose symporter-like transporter
LILTLIGVITTILFHLSLTAYNYDIKRQLASDSSSAADNDTRSLIENSETSEPKSFLKCVEFYQVTSMYIFARIFMTIALVYIPLWVSSKSSDNDSGLGLLSLFRSDNIEKIATIPLASFLSSFVTSLISKQTTRFIGHKIIYLLGCIIGISGCVWIALESSPNTLKLYLISIIFGAGHSMLIIASLSMTADFIGLKSNKGGSIYSAVTFFDKLLTGVAVFTIETL